MMLPFPLRGVSTVDAGCSFAHPLFASPPGLEPGLVEPKSTVLPKLDDGDKKRHYAALETPAGLEPAYTELQSAT